MIVMTIRQIDGDKCLVEIRVTSSMEIPMLQKSQSGFYDFPSPVRNVKTFSQINKIHLPKHINETKKNLCNKIKFIVFF